MCRTIIDDENKYERGNKLARALGAAARNTKYQHTFSSEQIQIALQLKEKFRHAFPKRHVFLDYLKNSVKIKVDKPTATELVSPKAVELFSFCEQAGFEICSRKVKSVVHSVCVHFERI